MKKRVRVKQLKFKFKLYLALSLFAIILLSGCISEKEFEEKTPFSVDTTDTVESNPVALCIALCQEKLEAGVDLSNGPCLANEMKYKPMGSQQEKIKEDWVCDVAHDPREDIDDLPENQCSYFREGKAHHFVEVTPECNLIRIHQ